MDKHEFSGLERTRIIAEDELFVLAWDKYPISRGHCLAIPRRRAARFCDLTATEKSELMRWIDRGMQHLAETLAPQPDGFNVGFNDGAAAGQTILQFHAHIIPRYKGDVADPRGGIRWVIPEKAKYWD